MVNTQNFKIYFGSQLLSTQLLQNIKGGKRSHSEKLERKRFKRDYLQIKKEQKLAEKLVKRASRNH